MVSLKWPLFWPTCMSKPKGGISDLASYPQVRCYRTSSVVMWTCHRCQPMWLRCVAALGGLCLTHPLVSCMATSHRAMCCGFRTVVLCCLIGTNVAWICRCLTPRRMRPNPKLRHARIWLGKWRAVGRGSQPMPATWPLNCATHKRGAFTQIGAKTHLRNTVAILT